MPQDRIQAYLAEHPRMMGVLFTVGLLAVQAGQVAANSCAAENGP